MAEIKEAGYNLKDVVDNELVIERIFDAPRALVWKAWTDPEFMKRWFGPETFTAPVVKLDLRVGGRYVNCMRSPEGQEVWSTGVYREIVEPERIVCTDAFADEHGNQVPGSYYGMGEDWPEELLVTFLFDELEKGKTKFTLHHRGIPEGQMRESTVAGWNGSFDKLAAILRDETGDKL